MGYFRFYLPCFWHVVRLILFMFSICSLHAISMQDVIELSLKNTYMIESATYNIESAKSSRKSLHTLFAPDINMGYGFSLNMPQNRASYMNNSINISGSMNIFNGMQDFYTYKKSYTNIKMQENDLDSKKNDIALAVKLAYIQILQNKEALKIARESIKILEVQLNSTMQFYEHGLIDKSAVLSIEVKLANAKMEQTKVQVLFSNNLNMLNKLSGTNLNADELNDIEVLEDINYDKENLLNDIVRNNPQFRAVALNIESNIYDRKISQAKYYPSINISGQKYWYLDDTSTSSIPLTQQTRLQLQATWNLTSGYTAFYQDQSRRFYEMSLMAQKRDLLKDVETDISNLLSALNVAKEQLKIAQIALAQANENYRIISNRYQQNIINYLELLNAELLLTNAKSALVYSRYEIANNIAKIEHFKNQYF